MQTLLRDAPRGRRWVLGGYSPKDWQRQLQICAQAPGRVLSCVGLHPWHVVQKDFREAEDLEFFANSLEEAHFVGELGLDYALRQEDQLRERQKRVFAEQLNIAGDRPLVLHVVKAHSDALEILGKTSRKGFVHGFGGSEQEARAYMDRGFRISLGPQLLRSLKLQTLFKRLPLDRVLIESDGPGKDEGIESLERRWQEVFLKALELRSCSSEAFLEQMQRNAEDLHPSFVEVF